MSPAIKIECLREPDLLFGRPMTGVEPRRIMARAGAVDHGNGEELSVGLVGPAEDIAIASAWLPRLNKLGIARAKSARRYRDWPGARRCHRGFVPCVFEPQDASIERHHIKGSRFFTPTTKRSAFPRIFATPKCPQFFRKPGIFDVGSYLCDRGNVVGWPHVRSPFVID